MMTEKYTSTRLQEQSTHFHMLPHYDVRYPYKMFIAFPNLCTHISTLRALDAV